MFIYKCLFKQTPWWEAPYFISISPGFLMKPAKYFLNLWMHISIDKKNHIHVNRENRFSSNIIDTHAKLFSHVWLFVTPWTEDSRLFCPWDFPGKNSGVGCHFLLQGIFLNQGLNLHLLHWQANSLSLSHKGSHTKVAEYILFSSVNGIFSKRDYMLAHKAKLGKFKKLQIISNFFFSPTTMIWDSK